MKQIVLLILFIPIFLFSQNKKEEKKAIKAVTFWLSQIDNEKYDNSWEISGNYFQENIQKDRWVATLRASRRPLGKLISRNNDSIDYHASLPGVPDGNYYIVHFNVTYENKDEAKETITLSKNGKGLWEVVGFFIK
tara:strand:- start:26511 stop:26918 length:408 start_codon:yes stop_codon:yes gene_type:complete